MNADNNRAKRNRTPQKTLLKRIAWRGQFLLDHVFNNVPISEIGRWLVIAWNTALAGTYIGYIVKYKLEFGKYEFRDQLQIITYLLEKSDTLILSITLFFAWLFLTKDSRKWVRQAVGCFSILSKPRKWKDVRGRWIIVWVILSNIVIYVGLAYFTDNIAAFSFLFMVHHLNAVAWLIVFRRNVRYYFHSKYFVPPKRDPQKRFILKRRTAMETFLCKTNNITRESLTSAAYGFSFLLTISHQIWNVGFYVTPFFIIAIAETINQFISFLERHDRDRDLHLIEEQEEDRFKIKIFRHDRHIYK